MTQPLAGDAAGEDALVALAGRLEAYAAGLPQREQEMLMLLLLRAMDPVDRMGLRDAATLLAPREAAFLRTLAREQPSG